MYRVRYAAEIGNLERSFDATRMEFGFCIYAGDIERKKMRADFGITYDAMRQYSSMI